MWCAPVRASKQRSDMRGVVGPPTVTTAASNAIACQVRDCSVTNRLAIVLVATAMVVAGCGIHDDTRSGPVASDGIRVASAGFAESILLAELYAQAVESAGIPVVRLGPIGPREVLAPALQLDLIDVVPEYLGTALSYFGAEGSDPHPDSSRNELDGLLAVRNLTVLRAASAQDSNVFVITTDMADRHDISALSDLADLAPDLSFGGPPECSDRPLCLAGLRSVYGLQFAEFIPQRSLDFTAEALRRGEIDIGLMFSTASQLEDPAFVVLEDDRGLQPAENIAPVVRKDALEFWGPGVAEALDAIAVRLTTEELRALNLRVADGQSVEDVAREWLADDWS